MLFALDEVVIESPDINLMGNYTCALELASIFILAIGLY